MELQHSSRANASWSRGRGFESHWFSLLSLFPSPFHRSVSLNRSLEEAQLNWFFIKDAELRSLGPTKLSALLSISRIIPNGIRIFSVSHRSCADQLIFDRKVPLSRAHMPLANEWLRQKFTTMRRNVWGSFLPERRKLKFDWAVIVASSKLETSDLMNLESKPVQTRFFFIFPLTNH